MPAIWEKRAEAIKANIKGKPEDVKDRIAYATATTQLQHEGKLKPGTRKLAR